MKKILLFFALSISLYLSSEIIKIDNLEPLKKALEQADQDTLVLFDVDETLIFSKDIILKPSNLHIAKNYIQKMIDRSSKNLPQKQQKDYFWSLILNQKEYELIDSEVVEIINKLQKDKIKTLALTAMRTGSYGVINKMEDWRYKQLNELSINFSSEFNEFSPMYVEVPEFKEKKPLFLKGILCTDNLPKGPTLEAFLNKINWRPKKVIFIDDYIDFLQSVEKTLKNNSIEFIGLHYSAASTHTPHDEKVAEYQFNYLEENEMWLSDEKAKELVYIYK